MARMGHVKHIVFGVVASLLLLVLYFGIVGLLQGFAYAAGRFLELWYLMAPLVLGFGVQVGLFSYIKDLINCSPGATATSGSMSTASMIACCVHHITDVIPILGISAIGIFLLEFQPAFLLLGIVSNLVGIVFIMSIAQKSGVKFKGGFFKNLMKYDFGKLLKFSIIAGIIALVSISLVVGYQLYQKYYGLNYKSAVSSELSDKCATPPGYTDESWKEHMSHHPERYVECLG